MSGSPARLLQTPKNKRMSMIIPTAVRIDHKRSNSLDSQIPVEESSNETEESSESKELKKEEDGSRIKVICRVRPSNVEEAYDSTITSFLDGETLTIKAKDPINFTYDKVFDSKASQLDIYEYSIRDTVQDVLQGYNGTILAYGQTGSGKSYTMLGPNISDEVHKGLIPRLSDEIFKQIKQNGSNEVEYTVSLSIMEIYLEQINDLLIDNNTKLSIHEDKDNGVYVKGLSHAFVSNTKDLYNLLQLGIKHRASNVTNMNFESSRSHAIFQIKITQKNLVDESIKKSNLFLIDLAGSEKVDRTGAIGQTLKEAKNINSSLSALGNVINALTDHKSTHIPYRDSKLTRILQESLGGNSRTTLILTIAPNLRNELETISTLRFGSRAKHIKNKAFINEELSPAELKFRLKQLERENEQHKLYIQSLEAQVKSPPTFNSSYTRAPTTPIKDFGSRIPTLTKSPNSPGLKFDLVNKLQERDQKIKKLEDEIINYKIDHLRTSNEEELKLNRLEKSLLKLGEKLADVEVININLRKHLMISEKTLEQRDGSIQYLTKLLNEQQFGMNNQTASFENKLSVLKHRINDQRNDLNLNLNKSPQSPNSPRLPKSPGTPRSPFSGLNLKIIKPFVGGNDSDSDESSSTF